MEKTGKDSSDQFMGARSFFCLLWHGIITSIPLYGMFLNFLVLPLVPVLMIAGIMILLTGGFLPLAAGTAAKVGHVILGYYKWICEGSKNCRGQWR